MTDYAEPLLKIKAAIKELETALPAGDLIKARVYTTKAMEAVADLRTLVICRYQTETKNFEAA